MQSNGRDSRNACVKMLRSIDKAYMCRNNEVMQMNTKLMTLVSIIFALAVFRLLPHLPNVSPVAAMALFGGAYFADKRMALIVPFVALLLTDFILGLHNSMLFVYAGFALTVGIGMWLQHRVTATNTVLAVLLSSVAFFLISNFGTWLMGGLYARTAEGLLQAYIAGLPFLQNSLLGNLVFTAIIFGGYELLKGRVPALREA